ncbi:MAG TPA: hypothetical protein VIK35_00115 [Verrucomicrobiae bacterium]
MDTDEREIFQFLKSWGADYVNGTEICRRAGGKRKFHEDPNWAKPILLRMEERGIVESDSQGRFRIKPVPRKKKHTQWVSPDIAKILAESGVVPDGEDGALAPDDFYDGL